MATIRQIMNQTERALKSAAEALDALKNQESPVEPEITTGGDLMSEEEVIRLLGYDSKTAFLRRPVEKRPPCYALSRRRRVYSRARVQEWLEAFDQR